METRQTRNRIRSADRKPLTHARLLELLRYDSESGAFTRIGAARPQSAHNIGKPVGTVKAGERDNGGGYLIISVDGRPYRAHRLAWFYMTGEWPKDDVDHRDTNRLNNRWSNLRAATRSQNIANCRTPKDNTSGIKGVTFDKTRQKWRAQIGIGKCEKGYWYTKGLGRFDTKEQAAAAYQAEAMRRFGEFARLT